MGVAFSCACASFALAVFILIPVFGSFFQWIGATDLFQQGAVLFFLFGVPVIGAIGGIQLGDQAIAGYSRETS